MLSTRQGIISVIVGTTISLFNALVQFLTLYWVLQKFGTEFNGYVRIVTSFSALISTADSALGIAATILLVKPLVSNDWITANEIYSTAKKNYKRTAIMGLVVVLLISFAYPLYAGVASNGNIFDFNNWKNIGISISPETNNSDFTGYWILMTIALTFGLKNFISAYYFSVYENIIAADNKNSIRRIAILFTDVFVNAIFFILLSVDSINPIIPFLPILFYSPIKGFLIYFYVKRKYLWLKYYKDFNSFKLNTTKSKISFSTLGTSLLLNTDILIASLILGLHVSSTLSLYLVVALNTRLIMTNFIISFREFFVTLVAKRGRMNWSSYSKYEVYTYLIAGFTFINMSILAPYFVSSLYGKLAYGPLEGNQDLVAESNALYYMFFTPKFSTLYAACTAFTIMCEGQMTLIQAKGRYGEVSKVQNSIGISYLVLTAFFTFLAVNLKLGKTEKYLIVGLILMYSLKLFFMVIRYCYLWVYVYKYATYNSNFKNVLNNFAILAIPCILACVLNILVISKKMNVQDATMLETSKIAPLIGLFFITVFCSGILLMGVSFIFSPVIMLGLISNLPFLNKIIKRKKIEERKKRFEEYGINVDDIVDNSEEISKVMYGVGQENNFSQLPLDTVDIDVNEKNNNIYVLKGK